MLNRVTRKRTILIVIIIFALTVIVYPLLFSTHEEPVDKTVPTTELPTEGP